MDVSHVLVILCLEYFLIMAMGASRFMYRMLRTVIQEYRHTSEQVKIMIIGAGKRQIF